MRGMRYQPQGAARPHSLAQSIGLDLLWCAPVGAIIGPMVTPSSGAVSSGSPEGVGLGSGYAGMPTAVPSMASTTWTEIGVVLLDGSSIVSTLSARPTGQAVEFQPANSRINLVAWGVADVFVTGPLPRGIVRYVVRRSGSAHAVWINGRFFGSATSSATPAAVGSTYPAIGARAASGAYEGSNPHGSNTASLHVGRTATALNDSLCQALSVNPWRLFAGAEEDDLAPAAQSYLMSAAAGSFSMSGTAVSLRAARRLGADVGQFTYLGANARLLAQRRVAAMAGEFAVNLSAVRGIVSRRMAAGTGSLALAAPSASLRVGRRLVAAPGALDIASSAVGMIYMQADEKQGYTLTAAAGSFGIVGADASLRAQRRLAAGSAALSLTGAAVRIAVGRRLVGAMGGFALQAGPAVLRAGRRVPGDAGAFGLVGTDAQLRYSSQIDYAQAPAGPGYTPQQRYSESRPAARSAPRPAATQRNYR